ncbi:MAG: prolipoprotein diacylglyceryl transferase [Bacteroidetes bacterium]|nr:prolipoprotein diacylglyceryl transferase [Bacteroidota bacterium]
MYPTLYDMFADLFGLKIPFLRVVQSFGFFVAISFLLAHYTMSLELKRKEKEGILTGKKIKTIIGKPYAQTEYILSGFLGFLLGFKLLPILFFSSEMSDPRSFLLSFQGNWILGIIATAAVVYYKYYEDKKQRKNPPVEQTIVEHPYQIMGNMTVIAAVAGLLGAKIFHNLENWDQFMADPVGSLLSFSGLTFFGGLICGGAAVIWYANKKGVKPLHMLDIGGPAMMLAYASGRIGCHIAGDGDWGIVNTAPMPAWLSWLPKWFWAYNYPNNVNGECNPYTYGTPEYFANANCNFAETPHLVADVFPTPLYEIIICGIFFFVLWSLRKKIKTPGVLFGIYMILAGFERFWIEKIRVNTILHFLGMKVTQAEIISVFLMLGGVALIVFAIAKHKKKLQQSVPASTP